MKNKLSPSFFIFAAILALSNCAEVSNNIRGIWVISMDKNEGDVQ